MANRTMAQKALKLQRQIRKLPKNYRSEYIPVGKAPNEEVLSRYSMRGRIAAGDHFRKQTNDPIEAAELARNAFLEAMFPGFFGHATGEPRRKALQRMREITQGVPLERNIVLSQHRYRKVMLFFDVQDKKAYIISIDYMTDTLTRSVNYGSRERAKHAYRHGTVFWQKKKEKLLTT